MVGNDVDTDIRGAAAVGMKTFYIHTAISPQLTGKTGAAYELLEEDWHKAAEFLLEAARL